MIDCCDHGAYYVVGNVRACLLCTHKEEIAGIDDPWGGANLAVCGSSECGCEGRTVDAHDHQ